MRGAAPARRPIGRSSCRFVLEGGDIVVSATIGTEGPFDFLLDTGSSRSAISTRLASRLGSVRVAEIDVATPGGVVRRPVAAIAGLVLGPLRIHSLLGMVLPSSQFAAARADGLIGLDVLGLRPFTIDYERAVIAWRLVPGVLASGIRLALDSQDGRLRAVLPQPAPGHPLTLVPDSGADRLVLFARPGRQLPAHAARGVAAIRTLGGQTAARHVVIDALHVGDVALRDVPAVVVNAGAASGTMGDGLLPLHLFARVTVDVPGGSLIVTPR